MLARVLAALAVLLSAIALAVALTNKPGKDSITRAAGRIVQQVARDQGFIIDGDQIVAVDEANGIVLVKVRFHAAASPDYKVTGTLRVRLVESSWSYVSLERAQ